MKEKEYRLCTKHIGLLEGVLHLPRGAQGLTIVECRGGYVATWLEEVKK